MSYLILRLKKKLIFRLDLGEIVPDKLKNKKKNVKNLKIFYGNEEKKLSDFFSFQGKLNKGIIFKGNLGKCDYIGNSMKEGEIIVNGSVGEYLGNKMENGKILVKGSAGNYAACSLKGGEILIEKNAGDYLGSSIQGDKIGISGGRVIVQGNVGNRLAFKMRAGIIFVKGNAKNYLGSQMIAGTIVINGKIGSNPGILMKRGTIILKKKVSLPLYFKYSGKNNYLFLKIYQFYLEKLNSEFKNIFPDTYTVKFVGDTSCGGKGEVLILN